LRPNRSRSSCASGIPQTISLRPPSEADPGHGAFLTRCHSLPTLLLLLPRNVEPRSDIVGSKYQKCLPNRVMSEPSRNFIYMDMQIKHIHESIPVSSTLQAQCGRRVCKTNTTCSFVLELLLLISRALSIYLGNFCVNFVATALSEGESRRAIIPCCFSSKQISRAHEIR